MTKENSFKIQKNKLKYISEQAKEIDYNFKNLKAQAQFQSTPATEFYKNAKLIYESEWTNAEFESIPQALSTVRGTLLPERAKYAF